MRLHLDAELLESVPTKSGTHKIMVDHAGKDGTNTFKLIDQRFFCWGSGAFFGGFDDKELNLPCNLVNLSTAFQ